MKIKRWNWGPMEETQCEAWQRYHQSYFFADFGSCVWNHGSLYAPAKQDDVVYLHRVLAQPFDLNQPIHLRQTSVDMDAAVSHQSTGRLVTKC